MVYKNSLNNKLLHVLKIMEMRDVMEDGEVVPWNMLSKMVYLQNLNILMFLEQMLMYLNVIKVLIVLSLSPHILTLLGKDIVLTFKNKLLNNQYMEELLLITGNYIPEEYLMTVVKILIKLDMLLLLQVITQEVPTLNNNIG